MQNQNIHNGADEKQSMTPFDVSALPWMSMAQADLQNMALSMLSGTLPLKRIEQVLLHVTGHSHTIIWDSLSVKRPSPSSFLSYATTFDINTDTTGWLCCEHQLVNTWLNIFGLTSDQNTFNMRSFGAITYLILRIIDGLVPLTMPVTIASGRPAQTWIDDFVVTDEDVVQLVMTVRSELATGLVTLYLPASLLHDAYTMFDWTSLRKLGQQHIPRHRLMSLHTQLSAVVGHVVLNLMVCKALAVGDMLLPHHGYHGANLLFEQTGRLYARSTCQGGFVDVIYRLDNHSLWQIEVVDTHLNFEREPIMSQDLLQHTTPASLLDESNTAVEVRIGHLSLSFEQLMQLQPGQVLTLDKPLGAVELLVHGEVIGTAQLVNIEGRLGAQVLTIAE